jgi:hypothetical protein
MGCCLHCLESSEEERQVLLAPSDLNFRPDEFNVKVSELSISEIGEKKYANAIEVVPLDIPSRHTGEFDVPNELLHESTCGERILFDPNGPLWHRVLQLRLFPSDIVLQILGHLFPIQQFANHCWFTVVESPLSDQTRLPIFPISVYRSDVVSYRSAILLEWVKDLSSSHYVLNVPVKKYCYGWDLGILNQVNQVHTIQTHGVFLNLVGDNYVMKFHTDPLVGDSLERRSRAITLKQELQRRAILLFSIP